MLCGRRGIVLLSDVYNVDLLAIMVQSNLAPAIANFFLRHAIPGNDVIILPEISRMRACLPLGDQSNEQYFR